VEGKLPASICVLLFEKYLCIPSSRILSVAFYYSQGYGEGIITCLHKGNLRNTHFFLTDMNAWTSHSGFHFAAYPGNADVYLEKYMYATT
jgi:hypothetical protein